MQYEYEYELDRTQTAQSVRSERAAFISRTYAHLAGAILAFIGLETVLVAFTPPEMIGAFFGRGLGQLLVFGLFIGASFLAQALARSEASPAVQYLGLGLYVVAQAVICLPLLYIAAHYVQDKTLIPTAGILALAVFGGLTLSVFVTKKDYSALRPILCVGSMIALGVIVASIVIGGFTLGLFFAFAMIALMSGFILYDTSNVLHHYRTDQHVSAALHLFADIATLFWYILYVLMLLNKRN
jgi:FtsH-binding integral membrane protein